MINYVTVVRKNIAHPEKPVLTYALAQSNGEQDIESLAEHMTTHGSPFSQGTIKAVLDDAVRCMREMLLQGKIVRAGKLGTFTIKLKSKGVPESTVIDEDGNKPVFTANDIHAVKVTWRPGKSFTNLVNDAQFKEVPTREVQALTLKEKAQKKADGTYLKDHSTNEDDVQEND